MKKIFRIFAAVLSFPVALSLMACADTEEVTNESVKETAESPLQVYREEEADEINAYYNGIIEEKNLDEANNIVRMQELCLTDEMTESMTTDELAVAVLNYPYWELDAYSTPEEFTDMLYENFNGLHALAEREDAGEALYEIWFRLGCSSDSEIAFSPMGDYAVLLMNQDYISDTMSEELKETAKALA